MKRANRTVTQLSSFLGRCYHFNVNSESNTVRSQICLAKLCNTCNTIVFIIISNLVGGPTRVVFLHAKVMPKLLTDRFSAAASLSQCLSNRPFLPSQSNSNARGSRSSVAGHRRHRTQPTFRATHSAAWFSTKQATVALPAVRNAVLLVMSIGTESFGSAFIVAALEALRMPLQVA